MNKITDTLKTLDSLKGSTKAFILIAILIVASSLVAIQIFGGNINVNITYEQRIAYLEQLTRDLNTTQHYLIERAIEQILNSSFYPMQKECSYLISKVGSYYCYQNGTTGKLDGYGTVALTIIQACHDALPSIGGIIFVKDYFSETGTLTINKSYVTLTTGRIKLGTGGIEGLPHIENILVETTSANLRGIEISGFHARQIDFYVHDDRSISGVKVSNSLITPSNTANRRGIIFRSSDPTDWTEWMDDFLFDNIRIQTYGSLDSENSGYGGITFIGGHLGALRFNKLYWFDEFGNSDFIRVRDGYVYGGGGVWFNNICFSVVATGNPVMRIDGGATATYFYASFTDSYWESDTFSNDLLKIDNATNTRNVNLLFNNVFCTLSTSETFNLIVNLNSLNANWVAGSKVAFKNFFVTTSTGTLTIGTKNEVTNFAVRVLDVEGVSDEAW